MAHGHLQIGRARRPLMAFVMVLSYSRRIFLRFFLDAHGATFMRGHAEAFAAFGGCARVVLYDNLKSAVLERRGDAIRFNPVLLEFAAHYRYEPRPVAVARGNERGPREACFVGGGEGSRRTGHTLRSRQLLRHSRVHRPGRLECLGAREAFQVERPSLLALPERVAVTVGKTPYARFDLNRYSVPHTHVRRPLSLLADEHRARILDGAQKLASHVRSWDRGQQIEQPAHIEALLDHKRAARSHRACDRLAQAAPASAELPKRAGEAGHSLSAVASELLRLLDRYGARALQAALCEALLQRDVAHSNAVRSGAGTSARGCRPTATGGTGAARTRRPPGRASTSP